MAREHRAALGCGGPRLDPVIHTKNSVNQFCRQYEPSPPFEQFAENLPQKMIEADTGIRFGILEERQFARIPVLGNDSAAYPLGLEHSKVIWAHCKAAGYIDDKGKALPELKKALKENTLSLPPDYEAQREEITQALRKLAGKLDIKDADAGWQIRAERKKSFLYSAVVSKT